MSCEYEHSRGPLSKDRMFRLLVNGPLSIREIERLIRKLEFDIDILKRDEAEEALEDRLAGKGET
jgi:hypothetical protein